MAGDVTATVRAYVLDTFLPGEDPSELQADTPLITGGILDSLARLQLVSFLESTFGIELAAHEVSPANLDTLADIAKLVESKQATS